MTYQRISRRKTLVEHANAELTRIGASNAGGWTGYYDTIAAGVTAQSVTITTTIRGCIVVVAASPINQVAQSTQICRGGVNVTRETTISANNFALNGIKGHLQYAVEVLPPGTYQYDLVNSTGGDIQCYGILLKAVAIAIV